MISSMDILTHALSGVLIGKAIRDRLEKLPPKIATYICIFSTLFPDLDFIYRAFSQEAYLYNHRGITHSFLMLPLWGILITFICSIFIKHRFFLKNHNEEIPGITKKTIFEIYILSIIGIFLHIFFDLITTYGTMVLSPVSMEKINFGSIFIVDLIFTGIICLGIYSSKKFKNYQYQPLIASGFFLILFCYIGMTQYWKQQAIDIGKNSIAIKANTNNGSIKAFPTALSPFKWKLISYSNDEQSYMYSFIDIRNDNVLTVIWEDEPKWGGNPILSPIAEMAWQDPILDKLRGFYVFPMFHKLAQTDDKICIYYKDLRFEHSYIENPFIYGICSYKNGMKLIEKFDKKGEQDDKSMI